MFTCTDKAKVDAIHAAKTPRPINEIMREIYPEATFDGSRYHAPCDGYECPLTGRVSRGGEYLPMSEEPAGIFKFPVTAEYKGDVVEWYGTMAQVKAVRDELHRQTDEVQAAISKHVGNVGDRCELTLKIDYVKEMGGFYGNTYFHIMHDDSGNVIIYSGTKKLTKLGPVVKITAKVKSHGECNGVKQTVVERPKPVEKYAQL